MCVKLQDVKGAEPPPEAVACTAIMVTGHSARAAYSLPCLLVTGLLRGGDSSKAGDEIGWDMPI